MGKESIARVLSIFLIGFFFFFSFHIEVRTRGEKIRVQRSWNTGYMVSVMGQYIFGVFMQC